ncbi:MAG: hypothetical protein IKC09_07330 [Oscillospiraceae bacterium]|nr:hypothetical protein [Oscillospiraceae bacterium]
MGKIYAKLVAISLSLVLSLSVVVMSSYAWFVLSESPMVTGIQVAIGGGNTILIAPDMTETGADGQVYHYPGHFSDTMIFSQHDSYDYLAELAPLSPVSTADGVNWFLPTYYSSLDMAVREGLVPSGQLKPIEYFYRDELLEYANLTVEEAEALGTGGYIYLDFWVVAPGGDFTLRISTDVEGDDGEGSFLLDLMEVAPDEDGDGYHLEPSQGTTAATARIGFLANRSSQGDQAMVLYLRSHGFDERFTQLYGSYQEPGAATRQFGSQERFLIYEPNGDHHPGGAAAEGSYVVTNPVGVAGASVSEVSVMDRLAVQRTNRWAMAQSGTGTDLEQRFQAAVLGMKTEGLEPDQIQSAFYNDYLQRQVAPYVRPGAFIKRTEDIYKYGPLTTADQFAGLDGSGAAEDVYIIDLERNVPQRIRMFIWLEGQDVDCTSSTDSSFAVNIELAGGTME